MSKRTAAALSKTTTAASTPSRGTTLQRKCACGQHTIAGDECEECRQKREGMMQRAAVSSAPVNTVPPLVLDVLNSSGQLLDAGTREFMEPRFGHDFSQVRVHTDTKAVESAQAVNALAYTVGRDVVFGTGQYTPGTSEGSKLLAHELTHVVQQNFGKSGLPTTLEITNPGDAAENEAQATANVVMQGQVYTPKLNETTEIARQAPDAGVSTSPPDAAIPSATAKCDLPTPEICSSYEEWLNTFPKSTGTADKNITSNMPKDLGDLIGGKLGASGNKPDCADVAFLLRHYYLKAKGQSLSFKVGPTAKTAETFKLGKGVTDKEMRICLINAGTESFQETRKDFKLVNFKKDKKKGGTIKNLKTLIDSGLKPGDMLVWQRLPSKTGNFQGHAQTIQAINPPQFDEKGKLVKGGTITVVQGNMSAGVGVGIIEQREYTFKELTGAEDGDADITIEPRNGEESFVGAGPWIGE